MVKSYSSEIIRKLNCLEPFSIIKITECYKQGFFIVIVDFENVEDAPGFLLVNKETKKVEFMTTDIILKIVKDKGGLLADGTPNKDSPYFAKKTAVTVRVTQGSKKI